MNNGCRLDFNEQNLYNELASAIKIPSIRIIRSYKNREAISIMGVVNAIGNIINSYDLNKPEIAERISKVVKKVIEEQQSLSQEPQVMNQISYKVIQLFPKTVKASEILSNLKQVDTNEVDDFDMGGIQSPPVSKYLEDIFQKYPYLETDFTIRAVNYIVNNSVIDYNRGRKIKNNKDLNLQMCSIKNRYFKFLADFVQEQLAKKGDNTTIVDHIFIDGVYDINSSFEFVLEKAEEIFTEKNMPKINAYFLNNSLDGESKIKANKVLNAFTAFMLFQGNNFDLTVRKAIGERVSVESQYPITTDAKIEKYKLRMLNHQSKIFGDDRFTDGEEKAGAVAKRFVESAELINHRTGKPTGNFLTYNTLQKTMNQFKDPEIKNAMDQNKCANLIKQLSNLYEENATEELKKILEHILMVKSETEHYIGKDGKKHIRVKKIPLISRPDLWTDKQTDKLQQIHRYYVNNLKLTSLDLDVLYSIYVKFYSDSCDSKSLYRIETLDIRRSATINSWTYTDAITGLILGLDVAQYTVVDKNGELKKISPFNKASNILRFFSRIGHKVTNNDTTNAINTNKYGIKLEQKNGFTGPVNITLNLNNNPTNIALDSTRKIGFKAISSSDPVMNIIETVPINVINDAYVEGNYKLLDNLSPKQHNYLKILEFISDITGIKFLGKDVQVLDVLISQYKQTNRMIEDLLVLSQEICKSILLNNEYLNTVETQTQEGKPIPTLKNFIVAKVQNSGVKLSEYYDYYSGGHSIRRSNLENIADLLVTSIDIVNNNNSKMVKDQGGNKIPLTRGYTVANHIQEDLLPIIKKEGNCYNKTLFGNAKNLSTIGRCSIFVDSSNYLGQIKKLKELGEAERNYSFIVDRYFNALANPDKIFEVQPVNYSDKPTIQVYPIPLNRLVYNGETINLTNSSFEDIKNLIKQTIGGYYKDFVSNVSKSYGQIYFRNPTIVVKFLNRIRNTYDNGEDIANSIISKVRAYEKEISDLNDSIALSEAKVEHLKNVDDNLRQQAEKDLQKYIDLKKSKEHLYGLDTQDFKILLSVTTESEFRELAWNNGINPVDIVENVHIGSESTKFKDKDLLGNDIDKKGITPNRLAIYSAEKMFDSDFERHLSTSYRKFVRDLINCDFSLYTHHYDGTENSTYLNAIEKVYTEKNAIETHKLYWTRFSKMIIAKDEEGKVIEDITTLNNAKDIKLNPLLERFFLTNFLLSYNLRLITNGSELGHPNKSAIEFNPDGTVDEFNTAIAELGSRDSASNKRHVDSGVPGTLTSRNSIYGIPMILRDAVVRDTKAKVHSINGEQSKVDSCDGSVVLNPVIALLYLDGMQDRRLGGESFKTMRSQYHSDYGTKILYKDAEFPMYNNRLRENQDSTQSPLETFRKMMDMEWDIEHDAADRVPDEIRGKYKVDITKNLFGGPVSFADRFPNGIYFKKGHKVYKIQEITKAEGENLYNVTYAEVFRDGDYIKIVDGTEFTQESTINSNWDLYQVLGGCYSGHFDSFGKFIYDDSSLYALVNYVNNTGMAYNSDGGQIKKTTAALNLKQSNVWQPLKNKMIASAAFLSAVKVGATNVNDADVLDDPNKRFKYYLMSSKNWFAVQDYDHIVTDGEAILTEFSQVITSMSAGGYLHNTTKELFRSLSGYSMAEAQDFVESIQEYIDSNYSPEHKSAIYNIIGKYIIKSSEKDQEDKSLSSGMVSDLKKIFTKNAKKGKSNHKDDSVHIAFSDPAAFAKAIVSVASIINKTCVKRKYPGGGMIMVPAFNMQMLYKLQGKHGAATHTDILNTIYSSVNVNGGYARTITRYKKSSDITTKGERESITLSAISVDDINGIYYVNNTFGGVTYNADYEQYSIKESLFSNVVSFLEDININATFAFPADSILNSVVTGLESLGIIKYNPEDGIYTKIGNIDNRLVVKAYLTSLQDWETNVSKDPSVIKNLKSYKELTPEMNIIPADSRGNYVKFIRTSKGKLSYIQSDVPVKVKIDSINDFFDILDSQIHFYPDSSQPSNLASAQIKIKKTNGEEISIYSIPLVRNAFSALEDISKIEDPKEQKEKKLQHLKTIQTVSKMLHLGYMPKENEVSTNLKELQENPDLFEKIDNVDTGYYEAVMPSIYREEFGLREGDTLGDVLEGGLEFFRQRWEENHRILWEKYDICFTRNNSKHRYISFKRDRRRTVQINEYYIRYDEKTHERYIVDDEENRLYTYQVAKKDENGEIIRDEDGNIIFEDYIIQIENPNGQEEYWCANEEAALSLYDKEEFDSLKINQDSKQEEIIKNFIIKGRSKEHKLIFADNIDIKDRSLSEVIDIVNNHFYPSKTDFQIKFNSFKKSLEIIAARIPAQTLQSFMKMKVVSFTGRDSNAIMVSHYQLWLQGSDFDIDKAYVMGFEISKAGKFIGWSPFFNMVSNSHVELSFKLPAPTMQITSIDQASGVDITEEAKSIVNKVMASITINDGEEFTKEKFDQQLLYLANNGVLLADIVNILNKIGTNKVKFNNNQVRGSYVMSILKNIVNRHNSYFNNLSNTKRDLKLPNKSIVKKAFKNLVARDIMLGTSHILNASLAQSPITMGDARTAAEESDLGKEDKLNTHWSPTYIPKVETDSMAGKDGIGVAANGEKVFFTLLHYCTEAILSGDYDRINKILFNVKYKFGDKEETKHLMANLNLDMIVGIDQGKLMQNRELLKNCIKNLYYNSSVEDVAQIIEDQLGFQHDQSLVISALLSAATDNAKELILGKINADPKFMNMYLYAIILGYDLLEVSKFMTSSTISKIISLCRENMHDEYTILKSETQVLKALINGPRVDSRIEYDVKRIVDKKKNTLQRLVVNKIKEQLYNASTEEEKEALRSKIETVNQSSGLDLLQYCYQHNIHINNIITFNDIDNLDEYYSSEEMLREKQLYLSVFQSTYKKLQNITKEETFLEDYEQFVSLRKGGQELTDIAFKLKINQGLGVTDIDKINILTRYERIYKDKVSSYDLKSLGKKMFESGDVKTTEECENVLRDVEYFKLLEGLDMLRFLNPKEQHYKETVLKITNATKHSFNGFDVIDKVIHINTLYKLLFYVSEADNSISDRMKKLIRAKNIVSKYNIDDSQMNAIKRIINEKIIFKWLSEQNFGITLKKGQFKFKNGYKVEAEEGEVLYLNTPDNLATFKYWFERHFMEEINSDNDLLGNVFVQNIDTFNEKNSFTGKNRGFLGIDLDLQNLGTLDNNRTKYNRIVEDFKKLKSKIILGRPITDWFFLYNVVVHKNMYGHNRFQQLFTYLMDDHNSLVYKYNKTLGDNDYFNVSNIGELSGHDLLVAVSPAISHHQGSEFSVKKVPYVRVFNEQTFQYELYKLKSKADRLIEDFTSNADVEQTEYHPNVEGYKYVKSLGDYNYNNYYTFELDQSSKIATQFLLSKEVSEEELSNTFSNLLLHNLINVVILQCD